MAIADVLAGISIFISVVALLDFLERYGWFSWLTDRLLEKEQLTATHRQELGITLPGGAAAPVNSAATQPPQDNAQAAALASLAAALMQFRNANSHTVAGAALNGNPNLAQAGSTSVATAPAATNPAASAGQARPRRNIPRVDYREGGSK